MKKGNQCNEQTTTVILQRLQSDLVDAQTTTGKPLRIYSAFKGYTLYTGINSLKRLLGSSLTPSQKTKAKQLLSAFKNEIKSGKWLNL